MQRGPYRARVMDGVMPAIWVINPLCASKGRGLIGTVITLGLGETSGVIMKGVVGPGRTHLFLSLRPSIWLFLTIR
jgi:hypothetical protein